MEYINNYESWKATHTATFGRLFSEAYSGNESQKLMLTAALIKITQRDFRGAVEKLTELWHTTDTEYEMSVLNYYRGLIAELCENGDEMEEYYSAIGECEYISDVPFPFLPYYRTGKLAARECECTSAIEYFRRSLSYLEGKEPDERISASIGRITVDIASVYIGMHMHDEAQRFLAISERYSPGIDQTRLSVQITLDAINGEREKAYHGLSAVDKTLKPILTDRVEKMLNKRDAHYFTVEVDRSGYPDAWVSLEKIGKRVLGMLEKEEYEAACDAISKVLSEAMSFMCRRLDVEIYPLENAARVRLKSYFTQTLRGEYRAFLDMRSDALQGWSFEICDEFFTGDN